MVFDGIMDFPVDLNYGYAKLNEWLNSSNVKIRATAMAIVGMFYFEGKYGMQQDYKRAFMCEKQAEELASVGEPYILGYCYLYGLGTKKDVAKAKSYILQSAKEGIEPAIALKKKKGW